MLFELLAVFGWVACLCGILTDYEPMKIVWLYAPAQTFCHVLTCLERYLAVPHGIIFRRLKEAKMIRIWLLSGFVNDWIYVILMLCNLWVNLSLSSFCSISVLCALNRPELQRRLGNGERMDKSKLMAFYTIMVILGRLWLRYFVHMLILLVFFSVHMGTANQCIIAITGFWFRFSNQSDTATAVCVSNKKTSRQVHEQRPRKTGAGQINLSC